MSRVETGESLGDIVLSLSQAPSDLSEIGYDHARQIQQEACITLQNEVNMQIDALQANGTLRIAYQGVKQVYRAFTPITMVSLGDGRVLHRSMFKLIMPQYGNVSCENMVVIDNIAQQEIIIGNLPVTYVDGTLHIDTPHIQATLCHIEKRGDGFFSMIEDA